MAKRIEPLSSRAHIVDQGPAKVSGKTEPGLKETPAATLQQPRKLDGPQRAAPTGSAKPVKKKRSFWRRLWIGMQIGFVVAIIIGCILGYLAYERALIYYARAETYDLKKLDDLNVTSTFYDVNGEELGRIFVEDRIVLKPEEIPQTMRQAVMAAEDRRFYQHGAIDYFGILRALWEDLSRKSHGVQGGSTIEQQLAKHLIGDFSRTMDRKFLEAFVARRLEQNLTKDQIMNYYLNRIYFGKGYFGVGAAARGYFGKEASELTVPECALLAGIIRAPTSSSPRTDLEKARWRRNATLKQMLEEHYIKQDDYARYLKALIHILPAKPNGAQTYVMAAAVKEMEQILSIEGTGNAPGLERPHQYRHAFATRHRGANELALAGPRKRVGAAGRRNLHDGSRSSKFSNYSGSTRAGKAAPSGRGPRRRSCHGTGPGLGRRARFFQEPI